MHVFHQECTLVTDPLRSDKLCSLAYDFNQNNAIELGKDEHSGAIIEEFRYFDKLSGKYPFICQFKVKTTNGLNMGIFAVIQTMRLRKNKTTGECIDYIQVSQTKKKSQKLNFYCRFT